MEGDKENQEKTIANLSDFPPSVVKGIKVVVKSHVFLCTLRYYTEWHLKGEPDPLLLSDEDIGKQKRNI
ncbi:MAG: hypothetical protein OXC03_07275 [Flavobacteriaceae bacterium]|nr:hypothetical protein [Flavobacteriaceae bacterium]